MKLKQITSASVSYITIESVELADFAKLHYSGRFMKRDLEEAAISGKSSTSAEVASKVIVSHKNKVLEIILQQQLSRT